MAKITDLVSQHERQITNVYNTYSPIGLTSHGDAIPDDKLWAKLGGDQKGKFKFNLQLVNTAIPNSVKNTALLSVLKSTTN